MSPSVSGEELRQQAMTAVRAGRFDGARTILRRARRVAGQDADQLALVALSEAYVDAELHGSASGIEQCRRLLGDDGLAPATRGRVWAQLALVHTRAGDATSAVAAYSSAAELLEDSPEHLGRALLNRGTLHLEQRRPRAAAADFEAAAAQLRLAGRQESQARALHNLGYARLLTGDLVGALRDMDAAATVLAPLSTVSRAVGDQDRAEVLLAAGRAREAAAALESAAAAYGSKRLSRFQAECELVLATTILRVDPVASRRVARRSARRFERHGDRAWVVRAEAAAVAADVAAGGRTPALLRRVDELAPELRGDGHPHDAAVLELQGARVSVRRGDLGEARRRLASIRLDEGSPVPTRLLWREVRAELARARGEPGRARQHVRAGLADLHAWQSSFGSLDLQSTLVGHGRDLAAMGLELAVADGDPAVLFEWSERARALVGRVPPVRPPADEELADDLTELRLLGSEDPERSTRLRERVRRRQWYAEGAGAVREPAGLEEVHAALADDGAALVAHVVVGGRITALVITPGARRTLDLGPVGALRDLLDGLASDLTMAAAHRDGPLARPLRASLRPRLATAADRLVTPLLDVLADRRLVLTPSGALAGTPWTLLPGIVGRPVTIPPSATRWLSLRGAPRPTSVGLVAGPGVARGEEEVTRAAGAWPDAEVLCGPEATVARVARAAERVDVLHLAGHGRHTRENPLFSAVELADGPWFGYDVDRLARTPATVVLSACELGRVTVRSGEEAIGMSAAWLHAGARTVLSSPVLIADDLACETMARWHTRVAAGATPADALAEVAADADDAVALLCFGGGW